MPRSAPADPAISSRRAAGARPVHARRGGGSLTASYAQDWVTDDGLFVSRRPSLVPFRYDGRRGGIWTTSGDPGDQPLMLILIPLVAVLARACDSVTARATRSVKIRAVDPRRAVGRRTVFSRRRIRDRDEAAQVLRSLGVRVDSAPD